VWSCDQECWNNDLEGGGRPIFRNFSGMTDGRDEDLKAGQRIAWSGSEEREI
jgi:hypothetical protein